jgi:hypothetical protein
MAKTQPQPPVDVLVLGEHPASYFTAALLKQKSKLHVLHATLPDEKSPDRLVLINPEFFDLHPLLAPLRRKLDTNSIYGLQFLSDDPNTRSEYRSKTILALIANYKDVRNAMQKIAAAEGVEFLTPKHVQVNRINEKGLEITLGKAHVFPRVLVLGGPLPEDQQKTLGLPEGWGADVVHRFTFVRWKGAKHLDLGGKPIVPMSLDLMNKLCWGWLLPCGQSVQIAVEQPIETVGQINPADLLKHWVTVLKRHNVLTQDCDVPLA